MYIIYWHLRYTSFFLFFNSEIKKIKSALNFKITNLQTLYSEKY